MVEKAQQQHKMASHSPSTTPIVRKNMEGKPGNVLVGKAQHVIQVAGKKASTTQGMERDTGTSEETPKSVFTHVQWFMCLSASSPLWQNT